MSLKIGIVGATGMVGQEMAKIMAADAVFSKAEIRLFASSARIFNGQQILALDNAKLKDLDFILGASDAQTALSVGTNLSPQQTFIDNSSAFRSDPNYPLVVPEINGHLLKTKPGIVANPNCTAILLCMTLQPLQQRYGLKRVLVSTYQAASGAGLKGLEELEGQIKAYQDVQAPPASTETFGYPLFLNVMSHNSSIRQEKPAFGYNDEEWKVISETQKILDLPNLSISATCMRVPVKRAHTETVTVDLEKPFELSEIEKVFGESPGLKRVNNATKNHFPMPLEAQNQDLVLVGRWRRDAFLKQTLHYTLSGDQVRKGAATNAVQILKYMAF